jgi:hypothetical protein
MTRLVHCFVNHLMNLGPALVGFAQAMSMRQENSTQQRS